LPGENKWQFKQELQPNPIQRTATPNFTNTQPSKTNFKSTYESTTTKEPSTENYVGYSRTQTDADQTATVQEVSMDQYVARSKSYTLGSSDQPSQYQSRTPVPRDTYMSIGLNYSYPKPYADSEDNHKAIEQKSNGNNSTPGFDD
jgi:hypothetical protein